MFTRSMDALFQGHDKAVAVYETRATILAENIANAETPGFKAKDIDFKTLLKNQQEQNHPWACAIEPAFREAQRASLNGNTVDAVYETSQFTQNSLLHRAALHFLSQRIQTLRSAITGDA